MEIIRWSNIMRIAPWDLLFFLYIIRTIQCLSPVILAFVSPLTSPRFIMSVTKSDRSNKDAEDGLSSSASSSTDIAHIGVKTVEATHKVYGKYTKWFLFIRYALQFLFLSWSHESHCIAWVSPPTSTRWMEQRHGIIWHSPHQVFVTTALLAQSKLLNLSSVNASPLILNHVLTHQPLTVVAVGKPVIAKIADVGSRGTAYSIVRKYISCHFRL